MRINRSVLLWIAVILVGLAFLAPAAAGAAALDSPEPAALSGGLAPDGDQEEGDGESNIGLGITLMLLGFVMVLLMIVAVIGATSLGVIGLGAWFAQDGE
jgi:hypothetical protein